MDEFSGMINKFSIVKQTPLFSKLNWLDIAFVVHRCSLSEYKKGEIIYSEGDLPNAFYCLVLGRLEAYTKRADGQKETLEYLYRGKHFGIISLLTKENHSVTIRAINDSIVLKIDKDNFERILKRMPNLGIDLSHSLSRRLKRKELHQKIIFESTIICVYSPRAKTGNSTYAINLALSLKKETNKKVALLNINSSTEGILDVLNVSKDLPSLDLKNITYKNTKIIRKILSHEWGIDLLNITYNPSDISQTSQISLLLSFLSNDYHYVVVDLPNRMDDITFKALAQSDLIHLVSFSKQEDLKLMKKVINKLREELKGGFREEKVKLIIRQLKEKGDFLSDAISNFLNFKIYATLPILECSKSEGIINSEDIIVIISNPKDEYARVIRRISREIGEVLVGLALGGGAAFGLAHIGVIKILEQENIAVDVVVGSSMGALIAAFWASGKNAKEIESVFNKFKNKIFSFKLLDFTFPISGLIRGKNIDKLLRQNFNKKTFRDIDRSLKIVSYDLRNRQEVVIDKGNLVDAIKESIAIPGIFRPILKKDMMLMDGGVLNPVPTNILAGMGVKKIIAVNTLASPEDTVRGFKELQARLEKERKIPFWRSPIRYSNFRIKRVLRKIFFPNIFDVIINSFQAVEYVLAQESCRHADIVISPKLSGINWFELFNVKMLIQNGEEETKRLLPQIKKLIKE